MLIGNLKIEGRVALAPMAGVADRAMREMCMASGAAFCIGELTSAKGVSMNDKKSEQLLSVHEGEHPMGSQLFGCDPGTIAVAAVKANEYKPDFLDINMGCPAPKVASNGCGSALMRDPDLAGRIVEAAKKAVFPLPVTVKMRAGWNSDERNAVEVAKVCESAGASMITVHGRTREQGYTPPVDYDIIRDVKQAVKVPVVGNGDIYSPADAAKMFDRTGCDMIMIGRGACGAPWIFTLVNEYLKSGNLISVPGIRERMALLQKQAELMVRYKDPFIAMLEIRKHAAWYIKGIPGAAGLRRECMQIKTMDDLLALTAKIIDIME